VVEGENAVEEHQDAVRDVEVIGGMVPDVFEAADNVIGAITYGAGGEWRQAFDCGGAMLLQEFFDYLEDISVPLLEFAASLDFDFGSA
jgi:hypothetical protein